MSPFSSQAVADADDIKSAVMTEKFSPARPSTFERSLLFEFGNIAVCSG